MPDEYKTTFERFADVFIARGVMPDPKIPAGDGWVLVSSAANADRLFWFWHRVRTARPCKCGALARKDGKCTGCGGSVDG
jgi:hypothetical protein